MKNWINVSLLNKTINKNVILNDISFSVDEWVSLWFIGDNGAGKTTTIKILAWINEPDAGEVTFDWQNVFTMKGNNTVGYLPEKTYFPEYLTGRQFIQFICELNNIKEANLEELFDELNILHAIDQKVKWYSKWMMQRLWFISLLVNKNMKYLFLDEPMSGLDHVWQIETIEIVKKLKARGITILITSHHMNEIEEICDEIVFIRKWSIIDRRSVKDILKEYESMKSYYLSMAKS